MNGEKYLAKNIPEWSIVKLPDGRRGVLANKHYKRGKALVKLSQKMGVEVSSHDELEVVESTAGAMMNRLQDQDENAALRLRCDALEAALKHIAHCKSEWDANKLGAVQIQRKRWLRMGAIAETALQPDAQRKDGA